MLQKELIALSLDKNGNDYILSDAAAIHATLEYDS